MWIHALLGNRGRKILEMKQIPVLIALFTIIGFSCFAQSAIVPVGGDAQSNNGSVSYTVGQIAVQTSENSNGDVTVGEGVQQPYEIMTVGVDEYPQIVLNAVVYPNPTENLIQLQLNGVEIPTDGFRANLYDGNGKLMQTSSVVEEISSFQIGQYATGNYFLELRDGRRVLKTFKVIRK